MIVNIDPVYSGGSHCPSGGLHPGASLELLARADAPAYFSGADRGKCGRLHLPCNPACDIQYQWDKGGFHQAEVCPENVRGLASPENAAALVRRALVVHPDIRVIGITGPGDALCTDDALRTFELIHAAFPKLINCLGTTGLALPGKGRRLVRAGVRTLTVTVHAVDPEVLKPMISHIVFKGCVLRGREAAKVLIAQQLAGIHEVAELGIVVKVNTGLIPGVNETHVGELAKTVYTVGASLLNISPLPPAHEVADIPAPTAEQLEKAREEVGNFIRVIRHCKRCREDAVGIPTSSFP